ncbi:ROK family protein [Microbacterium sp. 4R-513]|uniref:ROK family protein n=1 Tax=Microbacterium sp. 4R-513 TaxID=2567934 RepID=UPI0013E116CE|nr:ROK family protein [Microbacterium sp. 4R-513]QIG40044.1 ROK family protein [Microbacterium sp. 4R-513]
MTSQHPVLALDIGGTKLAVAMVDERGQTLGLLIEPTDKLRGPDAVIAHLFDMGRRSIELAGLGSPVAVGISCGGPLDAASGVLTGPLHLPGWIDIPIVDLARETFGVPAALENDATAAALAEHRFGAARGADTALYLTLSTGVGGGAVIAGRLHRGAAGNGGEFGHITVRPGGRLCGCGRNGCLEAYASGTNIADRAADLLTSNDRASTLRDLPVVRAEHVAAAAAAGDPLAADVWTETVEVLGQAITDLVNVFEPDVVVLGGGVTRSGAMLLEPVRDIVRRTAMPPAARAATVTLAALGDVVCVVGAGALGHDLSLRLDREGSSRV